MIIRTTFSKWGMCSDLSFLLRIFYKNRGDVGLYNAAPVAFLSCFNYNIKKGVLIMKRRILPVLLAASPYIYVFIVCSIFVQNLPLTITALKQILFSYVIMAIIIYLPSCVFAFAAPKAGVQLTQIAFWNMVIKLIHIPFYIVVFIFGGLLTVGLFLFGGPILALILAIMDYLLLLTSSTFGLSTLKQAQKYNLLDKSSARKHTICHFIFCFDIISAVMLYKKVKSSKIS